MSAETGDAGGRPGDARRGELAIAAVLVVLAVVIVALARRIEPGVLTDPLGSRAFPLALGAAIGLCGLLLAATTLAPGRFAGGAPVFVEDGPVDEPAAPLLGRLVAAVVLTAAYVAAFEPLGYLLATPAYVAAILLVQGGSSLRAFAAAPLLVTGAFYAAFRFGLLIPVPDGVLERWLPW
ncbi:MAG TPA: tripartite tricarboxylate transporter TctB family protein [Methylomirabilota bacterium]|nr:tripartite tricarboxylate transporter TctB family protein [Methylomirabilota bacterium]HEV8672954.1 tripartite tricarboxylate transporter TctB family protein [Methylomirabilota bacterium]